MVSEPTTQAEKALLWSVWRKGVIPGAMIHENATGYIPAPKAHDLAPALSIG